LSWHVRGKEKAFPPQTCLDEKSIVPGVLYDNEIEFGGEPKDGKPLCRGNAGLTFSYAFGAIGGYRERGNAMWFLWFEGRAEECPRRGR